VLFQREDEHTFGAELPSEREELYSFGAEGHSFGEHWLSEKEELHSSE